MLDVSKRSHEGRDIVCFALAPIVRLVLKRNRGSSFSAEFLFPESIDSGSPCHVSSIKNQAA